MDIIEVENEYAKKMQLPFVLRTHKFKLEK